MNDSEKLNLLADWFDKEEGTGRWGLNDQEVQKDLRRIADRIRTLEEENERLKGVIKFEREEASRGSKKTQGGEGLERRRVVSDHICPFCGAPEVERFHPRTQYACGSSDFDQRPGTFKQSDYCALVTTNERLRREVERTKKILQDAYCNLGYLGDIIVQEGRE